MRYFYSLIIFVLTYSCSDNKTVKEIIKVNSSWLDSIIKKSDTTWIKSYRNQEFVTAEYFVDRKDSIVAQLMKDSSGTIRQISIAKYDQVRLFFAEYYANGQLKAHLPLDKEGRYDGQGKFYYEDGTVKSRGEYHHGFYYGNWMNYGKDGKQSSTDIYDSTGQLVKSLKGN